MKRNTFVVGIFCALMVMYGCDTTNNPTTNDPGTNDTEQTTFINPLPISDDEVRSTGIPVIYIETQNRVPVSSKEEYVNMNLRIVSDTPAYCLEKTGFADSIRGRGNATWESPKKPYRIKFNQKTSLFGLERAKSWVLLADYRSPTLLQNVVAFELGRRFAFPFTNHYQHVELVLNGEYRGTYILTEHIQVGNGRVDIDEDNGFLVEFDFHYDEEPKFRTDLYNLPVMIKSPEDLPDIYGYAFVKTALNGLEAAMRSDSFPDSGYKDLIDIDNLVDYLMINDILMNFELQMPASVYMYKDAGGKINAGPLWDFDCGYGYENDTFTFFNEYQGRLPNFPRRNGQIGQPFFQRFFDDPEFAEKYKARWNEKYTDIASMSAFIDTMYNQLQAAQALNSKAWGYTVNYITEINRMKNWWNHRIVWLNAAINSE